MIIQDVYKNSKNNILFNDSKKFSFLRESLINNFVLSPKIIKNNESLKHLDPHILEFSYKYKKTSNDISYENNEEERIDIDVINGKITSVKDNVDDKKNIKITNITNENNLIKEKLLKFQNYFKDDYISNLNTILLNAGYEIKIDNKKQTNIIITNTISEEDLTIFQKNIITCSKKSKVFIIEEYLTHEKSNNNLINFIDLEEGAEVTHLIFQKNDEKANLQSTSYVNCKANSNYKQLIINISKGSNRNHHYANLLGENSSINLDGIFFGSKNQFIDNKTQINHHFPNCTSSQRYKGILTDQANASYLSKTFVNQIAQKTEAYQLSKGILLSDNSYFHSKPELEIFADDVKCSHGSTIGPIDRDLLFYLRSRGLSKKISTSLLIKSFFHDIITDTYDKRFIERFNYHSNIWLKENNI